VLGRFGEVIGKVTQTNGTTPIPNVSIWVTTGAPYDYIYCVNSKGVYVNSRAFIGVNNIVSAVSGNCGVPGNFAPEYWQESATFAGATPVVPTNTDRVIENVNFTLGVGATISGTVTQTNGTTPIPNAYVYAYVLENGNYNFMTSDQADASGQYQLVGLGTQAYYLAASATGYQYEYYQDKTDISTANAVNATAGANVPNINFMLATTGSTATVTGTFGMVGMPAKPHANWVMSVNVTITPSAGGAAVFNSNVMTDTNGSFVVSGIAPGSYTIVMERSNALPVTKTNVVLIVGNNPVDMGSAKGGDADGNNLINITDFSILATSFGKSTGQVGFDARADFNNDGIVNISDFSMLATYFGQSG